MLRLECANSSGDLLNLLGNRNWKSFVLGAAIAQWIRVCLPSCGPGSILKHKIHAFSIYISIVIRKRTKINKKRSGLGHFIFKIFCFSALVRCLDMLLSEESSLLRCLRMPSKNVFYHHPRDKRFIMVPQFCFNRQRCRWNELSSFSLGR